MDEFQTEARFPTCNTNMAACLAALRIPIKTKDPVWVVEEAEGVPKRTVTYFFETQSAPNNDGLPIEESSKVDWAWRHRKEFERDNPNHPLVFMRVAIDKLEWLIGVKYGRITIADVFMDVDPIFSTSDTILAATIIASGHQLQKMNGDEFVFNIPESERERIVEEYECFRHGKDPVCYMRKALECRKLLIALVKRAPIIMHYQNGDPFSGGKEGFIARGVSAEKLNRFFELLYE